jgi:hypothetical protein
MFDQIAETTAERADFFLCYSYADLAGQPAVLADPSQSTCWHIFHRCNDCTDVAPADEDIIPLLWA